MTVKVPKRYVQHPAKGRPEYTGDSFRAIDQCEQRGGHWWDGNMLIDGDGEPGNTHWQHLFLHGWRKPKDLSWLTLFRHLTYEQWGPLTTRSGAYKIHPMRVMIRYAQSKPEQIGTEVDLKCRMTAHAAIDMVHGLDLDLIQAKTMATLTSGDHYVSTPWERLRAFKAGTGCKTILICPRPGMHVPQEYEADIDYWRRFPPVYQ